MSRYAEKKVAYRAKEEQAITRHGFTYDQESINYRTQIPSLPEKPKHKPDEKIRGKKVQQIKEKIEKLKETKKKNKEISKKLTAQIDQEYRVQKNKVELGKRCIVVLEFDIEKISDQIRRKNGKIKGLQNKVEDLIFQLRQLKAKHRPAKKINKKLEEMTNRELDEQKNKIQLTMSTKSLNKKEESELNAQINRIVRLKLQENRPIIQEEHSDAGYLQKVEQIQKEIAFLREKEKKIKEQRNKLFETRVQLENKIEDIKEDITFFIAKLKEINSRAEQQEQTKKIREESEKIKESIKKLEEQISKVQHDFEQKVKEYEVQQQKINWISWATKIQEKKRQQWQQEKAERKKQKLKEKAAGEGKKDDGKKQQGKNKDQKGDDKQKPAFERKRINKNQKEIDICSFLIDYCKRLIPSNQKSQTVAKKETNHQEDIKNTKWAKGLEVIKSKKARDDEEENTKQTFKKKQKKQEEAPVATNAFTHQFFVEQYFHSANLIPPTKPEELQKILKDLEDKVEYYINHPDETVEEKFAKDKKFVETTGKNLSYQGKNTKSKGTSKSVINTEDFPAL